MPQLSPEGREAVADLSKRTGFSQDAVTTMLYAVLAGQGGMAQFSHPEFGGSGQWMTGGAIMLSDMFNNALKARVDALCQELAALVRRDPGVVSTASFQSQSQGGGAAFVGSSSLVEPGPTGGNWWPAELGAPASLGAQNSVRYAYFPGARRLAVDVGGKVTVYDTGDHAIGGFSQQQSGLGAVAFTSQHGPVDLSRLAVAIPSAGAASSPPPQTPPPAKEPAREPAKAAETKPGPAPADAAAILATLEKLADLKAKGVLTEAEFAAKKAELLAKL